MNRELQHRVETLLLESAPAADARMNGLFDRGDLEAVIVRLTKTIRELTCDCERLERERNILLERMSLLAAGETESDQARIREAAFENRMSQMCGQIEN